MIETLTGVLFPLIAPAIGKALAGLVGLAFVWVAAKVAAKTKDEHKLALIDSLTTFAQNAVLSVEQTYVDEMKKQGKWQDPASHEEALKRALEVLKVQAASVLPQLGKMGAEVGEEYLKSLLEAALRKVT